MRQARNTMGPVQKAKIKGSVDPAIAASLATQASAVSPVNVEPVPPKAPHATEPAAAPAATEPAPAASPANAPAAGGHGAVS